MLRVQRDRHPIPPDARCVDRIKMTKMAKYSQADSKKKLESLINERTNVGIGSLWALHAKNDLIAGRFHNHVEGSSRPLPTAY